MKAVSIFVLLLLLQIGKGAMANINPNAPRETHQFATMMGTWKITDYQLVGEGKWQEGAGATWVWRTILDGFAIQDEWQAPINVDSSGIVTKYQHGTNIRIYNPKKHMWEMAWMSNTGMQIDTFTAIKDNNEIVMRGFFNGKDAKITFYDMDVDSFRWKLEFETEKGWQEVYRIHGSKQ